jgi:hypothetical protein
MARVSIKGKVPLSTQPLIWSTEAGYPLQIEPKTGNKSWLRLASTRSR